MVAANQSSDHALFWTFLAHYKWDFVAGIIPRLANTGFNFSQPFLVQRVLDFTAEPMGINSKNTAYALVAAYAIVYIGLSVSHNSIYHEFRAKLFVPRYHMRSTNTRHIVCSPCSVVALSLSYSTRRSALTRQPLKMPRQSP